MRDGARIGGVRLAVSTVLSGFCSALPRVYAAAPSGGGVFTLLLWQGMVSCVVAGLVWARGRQGLGAGFRPFARIAVSMSFFNVAASALLVVALRRLDGAVVYPVRAVGNIAAVFALSFVLFKERVRPSRGSPPRRRSAASPSFPFSLGKPG